MASSPQTSLLQTSLPHATRLQLLVSCGIVFLIKRLTRNPQNRHRSQIRCIERIFNSVYSPSILPFPYWKLFFQGRLLYQRGKFCQAVSCFEYAPKFQIGEACSWLSMMRLGGRTTVQQDIQLAVAYAKKAEELCPQKERIVCDKSFFFKQPIATTLMMFPELQKDRDAELLLTPPPGIDPDLQVSVDPNDPNGKINIFHGERKFRQHQGKTVDEVFACGSHSVSLGNHKEAWICFYLLTKLNVRHGFSRIADLYQNGYGVSKCLETADRCRLKRTLKEDEDLNGTDDKALARSLWSQGNFPMASWFYILASFHGCPNSIGELLRLRRTKGMSLSHRQASIELETARAWVVCSNYQKAEWHYHLAIFYGSEIAANEVDAMRDLIYYLEGGE